MVQRCWPVARAQKERREHGGGDQLQSKSPSDSAGKTIEIQIFGIINSKLKLNYESTERILDKGIPVFVTYQSFEIHLGSQGISKRKMRQYLFYGLYFTSGF